MHILVEIDYIPDKGLRYTVILNVSLATRNYKLNFTRCYVIKFHTNSDSIANFPKVLKVSHFCQIKPEIFDDFACKFNVFTRVFKVNVILSRSS